jgi:hypothetical protein
MLGKPSMTIAENCSRHWWTKSKQSPEFRGPLIANPDIVARPRPKRWSQTNHCCGPSCWTEVFGSNRFVQGFDVQREQRSTKRDENQWLRKWETMIVNTFNEHNYAVKLQCNQESKLKLTPNEVDCITQLCGMNCPLITLFDTIHLEHYEVKWFCVPKNIEGTRRSNTKQKGKKIKITSNRFIVNGI